MSRKVQWELMLKHELDEAVAAFPVAWLSFGLCEPHGLYNPLGLDELKAHGICVRAAEEGGGIVAPACYWHVHEESDASRQFLKKITAAPLYLTDIPADLFRRQYLWQLRACVNAGCRAVVALSGHYGGIEFTLKYLAKLFQRHVAPIPIWALADWEVIWYRDEIEIYNGNHAGLCETAQLQAFHPELPRLDLPHLVNPDPYAGDRLHGLEHATPERGAKIVESQVRNLAAGAKRMIERTPAAKPAFIEFDEMERAVERIMHDRLAIPDMPAKEGCRAFTDKYVRPKRQTVSAENRAMPDYVFPDVELTGS